MNINNLINEAKKRYKVGDRFKVVHQPDKICTIKSFDIFEDSIVVRSDGRWHFNLLVIESQDAEGATVCKNGKWAEKVEPEKTAEELAAELGFRIGDKVWNKNTKQYLGIITKFDTTREFTLPNEPDTITCTTNTTYRYALAGIITNKVAIHCPTESDKNFVKAILNIKHSGYCSENNVNVCFHVNGSKSFDYKPDIADTHLILSIDEYMKSQGIKPVFVTEDGKNIYEGENCWKVGVDEERKLPFISHITAGDLTDASEVRYFSNEYNAKNYYSELIKQSLRANTGKFEIGDKVKVTRKCESYEGGWDNAWSSTMDRYVNGTYEITNESPMSGDGYRLDCGYWFPEFVLEKVVTKYLADEFQVLKLEPYENELPTSPKGKLFDTLEEANAYHESIKPNTYTVELPKGYEVKREYVVLDPSREGDNIIDGIFLKLKHI